MTLSLGTGSRSAPGRRGAGGGERAFPGLPPQRLRDCPFLLPSPTEGGPVPESRNPTAPASLPLLEPAQNGRFSPPGARAPAVLGYTSTA